MSLRMSEADLAAFERKRAEWDAAGQKRTHSCQGPKPEPRTATVTVKIREPKPPARVKLAERDVQRCALEALENHPQVAFAWRANVGMGFGGGHAVRFNFAGCSDILGMLRDGRFLAIECKATGKVARPDQQAFLDRVRIAGGLSICIDDPAQLIDALERI